jgi:hypothetical protein
MKIKNDFPEKMSAPALRALLNEKIYSLADLAKYSEKEILKFHGMGPASIPLLKEALKKKGLKFKDEVGKKHRIYTMIVASVYPMYVLKAEKKGRTKEEVDQIITWLTGYSQKKLEIALEKKVNFEEFFAKAPKLNPARSLISGVICGVRIEEITDPLMRELRYLDKLVDELAKGRPMEKILRK